jgi:hypothetical protein
MRSERGGSKRTREEHGTFPLPPDAASLRVVERGAAQTAMNVVFHG